MRSLLDTANRFNRSSQDEMLAEFIKLTQILLRQILSGETPDIGPVSDMASQLASGLQPQGKSNAEIGTGKTPSPGMKTNEFADKQKEISEAVRKWRLAWSSS
jgi:hypothetical protein